MTLRAETTLAGYARAAVDLKTRMHEIAATDLTRAWISAVLTDPGDQVDEEHIDAVQRMVSTAWMVGDPYVLAPAMTAVVAAAADALDLSGEVLRDEDAPSDHGALFLPEPICYRLRGGEVTSIGAVTWSKFVTRFGRAAWAVFAWSERDDPLNPAAARVKDLGPEAEEMLSRLGPYVFNHVGMVRIGEPVDAPKPGAVDEAARVWEPAPDGRYCIDAVKAPTRACVAIAYAFWRIATEPLATVASPPLGRATRRRAARACIAHHARVVMLRRTKTVNEPPDGDARWRYRVRFVVRGHWRRLTLNNGQTYRIWIHDYIKGPDGAPLLGGEKVNVLGR